MNRILALRTAWGVPLVFCAMVVAPAASFQERPGTIDTLTPLESVSRQMVLDVPGSPRGVEVQLRLQPEHASQHQRLLDAAAHALQDYARWFGPYPHDRLIIVDVPWRSGLARHAAPALVTIECRWIVGTGSVATEADVARAISRLWWGGVVSIEDASLAEELVEYSQGLTVERLFADRNGRPGYSALEARYFGGFVPWTYRVEPLTRAAAAHGRSGGRLLTLERYLGWPALQRGLAAVTGQRGSGGISRDRFFQIVGDTTGQDLQWFSMAAFDGRPIDYAIAGVTSVAADCDAPPCFRTTVIARRNGVQFTGSSREPLGGYESGRAIGLLVTFQDGATATDAWDGRSESKTFVYESRTQAVSAEIDPDHVLVLDSRKVNNSRRLAVNAPVAANRWSAHWMVWLQDVLLSYASLV